MHLLWRCPPLLACVAVVVWWCWPARVHASLAGTPASAPPTTSPFPASALTATPLQVRDEIDTGALFAYLKFSLDGQLLLAVAEGRIYLLDSFEGTVKQKVGRDESHAQATANGMRWWRLC